MGENHVVGVQTYHLKRRVLNIGQTRPEDMSNKELLEHIKRDPKDEHLSHELFRRKLHVNMFGKK